MPINRLIYGAWGLILIGAVGIAGYNLKPRPVTEPLAIMGEAAPSLGGGLDDIQQTEFIQDVPGRLGVVENDPLAASKLKTLGKVVKDEMPNASAEEVRIWADEFKDLPEEAVRFLLRQKRHSDGNSAATPLPTTPDRPDTIDFTPTRSSGIFELARRIATSNLLNESTSGYREQVIEFQSVSSDEAHVSQLELAEVRSSTRAGKLDYTGRALDVALSVGFFAVSLDGDTYFTRCGRFSLNAERRLVLRMGDIEYTIDGVSQIPAEATTIEITLLGAVRASVQGAAKEELGQLRIAQFLDASRLKSIGGCLFQPSIFSGQPSYDGSARVEQGQLEGSNVSPDMTRSLLKKLDEWESLSALSGSGTDEVMSEF